MTKQRTRNVALDTNHITGVPSKDAPRNLDLRTTLTERTRRGKTTLVLHTRYNLGGKPYKTTKTLNLRPTKRNRLIAAKMIEDFEHEIRETVLGQVSDVPFSAFAKETFDTSMVPPFIAENTSELYGHILGTKVGPFFMDLDVRDIKFKHLDAFAESMLRAGYSASYAKTCIGVINKVLERALKLGFIDVMPKRTIQLPTPGRVDYFDKDEVESIMYYLDVVDPSWKVLYLTLLTTGMRIGELLALKSDDICFKSKSISITKSWVRGANILRPPKKDSVRTVPINKLLEKPLRDFLDNKLKKGEFPLLLGREFLFEYRVRKNVHWYPKGSIQKLTHGVVTGHQKLMLERLRLRHRPTHIWRHTCASLLAQSGKVMLHEIQALLGHKSIETTEIYSHLLPPTRSLTDRIKWY